MFMHQGQHLIKELRFHPQYRSTIFTTAMDSFNIFRPNLEPVHEPEESKTNDDGTIKESRYEQDEEDSEEEERRIIETAKALNAQRRSKSKGPKRMKQ